MVNFQYQSLDIGLHQQMPQTVPSSAGYSPSFDYSTFQFDLSLLPDDYGMTNSQNTLKVPQTSVQIKQEVRSPRPGSPTTYPSPPYPGTTGGELPLSPNYSHEGSPGYPTSPYYVPRSPQSAQFYPNSPEPTSKTKPMIAKEPVKREKSFDLLTILQESRLLAESLGYREDSTDCTVPCTPPRTEEDIYNSLDADFFPKKKEESTVQDHPLLKEILFKEVPRSNILNSNNNNNNSVSPFPHSSSSSTVSSSPGPIEYQENSSSPLRDLLFKNMPKNQLEDTKNILKMELVEGPQEEITATITATATTTTPIRTVRNSNNKSLEREEELFKDTQKSDHQLLREVLRDTSFQRKYNLRPVDLGSVGTGFVEDMVETGDQCVGDLAREQIEPVLSLAIQQLQKDFDNTCVALGIHPEPSRWSAADVAAWVQWARRQLQLPSVPLESFNIDGITLASLTEEEFCQRAPQCGSMLHAQLEIWKAAVEESPRNTLAASWSLVGVVQSPNNNNNNNNSNSSNSSNSGSNSVDTPSAVESVCSASIQGSIDCTLDFSDDEDEECSITESSGEGIGNGTGGDNGGGQGGAAGGGGKIRNGGSHIHLWQFLKELLQSPSAHGSCIRWLDRSKGVFKIEDSVRVARLWGKRKNRPAMNYDKLSRSIRQYYKKGIMKKTERSQRLVYQFCHPYSL